MTSQPLHPDFWAGLAIGGGTGVLLGGVLAFFSLLALLLLSGGATLRALPEKSDFGRPRRARTEDPQAEP